MNKFEFEAMKNKGETIMKSKEESMLLLIDFLYSKILREIDKRRESKKLFIMLSGGVVLFNNTRDKYIDELIRGFEILIDDLYGEINIRSKDEIERFYDKQEIIHLKDYKKRSEK